MAYTNVTVVRKHLADFSRTLKEIENLLLKFDTEDSLELPHKGIKSSSEKVKAREANEPDQESLVLANSAVSLSNPELVPDSVVVAKDSSLTTIYLENIDYTVADNAGAITRISGGNISSGQTVIVWYFYFRVYQKNTDYAIAYDSGKLTRITDGAIESGQNVYLDYKIENVSFSDESVARAIEEAHVVLLEFVDEQYNNCSDNALEVAETYLALDILARMKGLEVLQADFINPSQKNIVSDNYLSIGVSYYKQASDLLQRYLKPGGNLAFPTKIRKS